MKKYFLTSLLLLASVISFAQQASEIDPKFVKLPRYANLTAITTAIPTPTQGMMVYNMATISNWYFNGSVWTNMLGGSGTLTLPYSQTQTDASTLFSLTNTGTGAVGNFAISNSSNLNSVIKTTNQGLGFSGEFKNENTTNTAATIFASNAGDGVAGQFVISKPTSLNVALNAINNGLGQSAFFQINNVSNSFATIEAITSGSGEAFSGTNNSANKATAKLINNNGTGLALQTSGGLKFGGNNVGTPAAGKVLTAIDSDGNTTWQAIPTPTAPLTLSASSGTTFTSTSTVGIGGFFSSSSGYALITGTGNVGIGNNNPTAKLDVAGFTKLGDDATVPKIKMKKITGVGPTVNGNLPVAHGINDASKIISVQIFMEYGNTPLPTKTIPPNYTLLTGFEYQFEIDGANILITNKSGNSANIGGKNYKMLITYEQ